MKSDKKPNNKRSTPLDLKIHLESNLKCGDVIEILSEDGSVQEYAYLSDDIIKSHGLLITNIVSQRTGKTIEIIISDAIHKI